MDAGLTKEYRGAYIADIPRTSGIYAWYFSPLFHDIKSNSKVFSQIAKHAEVDYQLAINLRYGLKALSSGSTYVQMSGETIDKVLADNMDVADPFLRSLIDSGNLPIFTRPLYIGISNNLYQRVCKQHYKKMAEYWDVRSGISVYIKNNPNCTVQQVIDNTTEPHSFALEARVRNIPVRDLMVVVHEVAGLESLEIGPDEEEELDDSSRRRSLERILHLLTDPICGRK